jgi:2'-5' RNA ligase
MNTCAALCLRIENPLQSQNINLVRREHDKAFERWMPHINFIFPFIPEDQIADAVARLGPALKQIPAFDLVLDTIGHFEQRDGCTVHLKPSDETQLQRVFAAIRSALPEIPARHGGEFHPHLTVGQWPKAELPSYPLLLAQLGAPFRVRVDHISIITRPRDGPFVPHTELALG